MIKKVIKIFIGLVFIFGVINVSAQSKWDRISNIADKSVKEGILENVDETILPKLKETLSKKAATLASQSSKIADLNLIAKKANSQIKANNKLILKFKALISKEQKGAINAASAKRIRSHMGEIDKLIIDNKSQKKILKQRKTFKTALQKAKTKLKGEVSELKRITGYIKRGSNLLEYDEAVVAGVSVMGEFAEWTEGNSSFRNVMLRAIKDGGKAAVSIGAGALGGAVGAATSMNPFAAGGAAILSSVSAEEFYESTIGKSFERLMSKEHDAINKYAVDPIELEKMRFARKVKLYEEIKKTTKEIAKKQDEYNDFLRNYIEERRRLWAAWEEKMKQDAEEQRILEAGETPLVTQKPNTTIVRPGESVTISVETTGGLLPIRYSGELSYEVDNNSDRYLIAYQWTPDKNQEPGIYELTVNATSASGKVGSNTIAIEVVGSKPAATKDKEVVKKEVKMGSFLMGTDLDCYLSNTSFIKIIEKYGNEEAKVVSNMTSYFSVQDGRSDYKKVSENNMGPNFSLTVVKETTGKTDKRIFSKETRKVSGSISSDIKTVKLLTIEVSYVERNANAYDTETLKTLYTDVKRNYTLVFENLPIYAGPSAFEYQKEKNLPHSFTVKLRDKAQLKKHLKSFSYNAERVREGTGQTYSARFSHFDWDNVPDNMSLEIKIGKD